MQRGRLFLPQRLAKKELAGVADREAILAAWRKGIFDKLPAKGIDGCRLLKAYLTTAKGPRRTLYLLQDASGDAIFLLHRAKGDTVGDNMAYSNPAFVRALDKAVTSAAEDIEAERCEVIEGSA